jgi:hypothetical protein
MLTASPKGFSSAHTAGTLRGISGLKAVSSECNLHSSVCVQLQLNSRCQREMAEEKGTLVCEAASPL